MSKSKKVYVCSIEGCKASFKRLDRLESHNSFHTNERPYICSYDDCDKSYNYVWHLNRHLDTHEENYRCIAENCNQSFVTKDTLRKHNDNMHLKKKPKTYKCSHCDEQFNKHCWLTSHEYRHTGIKPYLCSFENCGKRFLFPSRLNRHLKVHKGIPCIKPECKETFSKWSLYQKHLKVEHPIIHKCNICNKKFSTLHNLKAHLTVHSDNKESFECPEPGCNRLYYAKRNLAHHIKSYHRARPFVCKAENCYKTFKTESEMTRHFENWHDPNKRLRRKKKKSKPKPSFAAVLAGGVDKNKRKKDKDKPKIEARQGIAVECSDAPVEKNQVEGNVTNQGSVTGSVDEGMQEVLFKYFNERDALSTANKVPEANFVPFIEFIKL